MFSTTLRHRSLWRSVQPLLLTSKRWKFKESSELYPDLRVPLMSTTDMLHVEILTTDDPDAILNKGTRRARDENTEKQKLLVLVDVDSDDGGVSFMGKTQIWQLQHHDNRSLVLVPDSRQLLVHLMLFVDNLTPILSPAVPIRPRVADIMAMATATIPYKPLTRDQAAVVKCTCQSIQGLEEAIRTIEGQKQLLEYLDESIVQNMGDFWKDEWIV